MQIHKYLCSYWYSQVVSADMLDITFEFSAVYWRHNFSLVPTTTTTTTTSISTTSYTPPTTHENKGGEPAYPPPVIDVMGNDIAADESRDSVTEDKYKLNSDNQKQSSSDANSLHLYGVLILVSWIILFRKFI